MNPANSGWASQMAREIKPQIPLIYRRLHLTDASRCLEAGSRGSRVPPTICLEALECVPPTICLETLECLSRLSSASNNLPRDSRVRPLFLSFARMFVESQCDECLRGLEAGSRGSRGSRDPPTIASHMAKLNVYPYQNFEMYAMSAW